MADDKDNKACAKNLQQAIDINRPTDGPEAFKAKLQANIEEQEHHAQLAHKMQRVRVVQIRRRNHTCYQIAQHTAHFQCFKRRYDCHCNAQQQNNFLKSVNIHRKHLNSAHANVMCFSDYLPTTYSSSRGLSTGSPCKDTVCGRRFHGPAVE